MGADVLYKLEIPWDTGVDVIDPLCDVTADAMSVETFRGRDYASQLTGRSAAGTLKALMRNEDVKYSFNDPASVLAAFANFRTGIPIQFSAGIMVGGVRTWYVLWRGVLDALEPDIDRSHFKSATLRALGDIAHLAAAHALVAPDEVLPGEDYTGLWVQRILEATYGVGNLPAPSDYDDGQTLTGTFFAETENSLELIRQMEDSEGGQLYEDVSLFGSFERQVDCVGPTFGFADRYRRLTAARSTAPQYVFSDSPGAGEISILEVKQQDPTKEIYNQVQVEVQSVLLAGNAPVPTIQSTASVFTGSVASVTQAFTVGTKESRLLRVTVSSLDAAGDYATGVTYNGVPMTLLARDTSLAPYAGWMHTEVYYMVAPPSGTYDVVVTWPDSQLYTEVGIEDWYYVDQTTPWGTPVTATGSPAGAGSTFSIAVASAAGELVVDSMSMRSLGAPLIDDEDARQWQIVSGVWTTAASIEAGAPSVVASWETTSPFYWVLIACSLKPDLTLTTATVWTLGEDTVDLAPGESKTFTAQYPNPASGGYSAAFVAAWVTPVAGTDITNAEGGSVPAALTISAVKKPRQMDITLTNTGGKKHIVLGTVSARAVVYTRGEPTLITVQDQTSIDTYGLRSYKLPAKWLASTTEAHDYAQYVLSRQKDPLHILTLVFVASKNDAAMAAAVLLRLGDMVTVVADGNAGLGLSEDFYVESISHRIDQGRTRHITTLELSAAAGDGAYWILGTGLLGSTTKLGY